jgi:predicted ATPase/class 3 adenylate cyclase
MTSAPSATVTLLFTDIEGSTRLLQLLGEERYSNLLSDHRRLLREAFGAHGGVEEGSEGDGLYFRFSSARDALAATVAAQRAIAAYQWPEGAAVRVRMGLHTGEPAAAETGYVGIDIHRAARISATGHGGQILLSQTTRDLIGSRLPPDVTLADLGEHSLKDLRVPEHLFQVVATGLPSDFPPLRTVDARPNNLPRVLSTFVGREREIAEAKRILAGSRLITLTGPGGVGKTRLSLEVASQLLDQFDDGVWVVELGTLTDSEFVLPEIASILGLGEEPGRPLLATITAYLAGRRLLLVLDNCEHVLAAVASATDSILRACPTVRIVGTSQEPLGIDGEATLPVGSLSLPDPERKASGETVLGAEAVRLFADRAAAALPTFLVSDRNAEAVARICRRLDGIPLAIELAAARVRALPVEQIAARLDDRFRLLTGGSRVAVPRHQTLRAAMDWSYELLSEEERTVLRRLSVFAGTFTLEAAEAVVAAGTVDSSAIFDLLSNLVDKSLVQAGELPDESSGEARFGLLETVREYGAERAAAADETEDARRRHRDWFLALVDRAAPAFFRGPVPQDWLRVLALEHENLRAALAWSAAAPGEQPMGLRMAAGLWRFWEIRGDLVEGRSWLEGMLTATGPIVILSPLRANALTGAGILAFLQGDYESAFALHQESLALHRRLGDAASIGSAANNLANTAVQLGEYELARQLYEEPIPGRRASGDSQSVAFLLMNLADVVGRQGDFEEARRYFEESIEIFRELGHRWGVGLALDNFGLVAGRTGDAPTARSLHEQALGICRELGDERGAARVLSHLGDLAAQQDDAAGARALYRESLAIREAVVDLPGIASAIEKLAWVLPAEEAEGAVRLVGCAEALRASIRAPVPPDQRADHERHLRELETTLGGSRFEAVRGEGRTMHRHEAVASLLP